jgi:hypothetical protein
MKSIDRRNIHDVHTDVKEELNYSRTGLNCKSTERMGEAKGNETLTYTDKRPDRAY